MTDELRLPRFPLPDDWQPPGLICVKLVIPDDPQYLAMLTGLIDQLTWSRNFARDDTGTGAAIVSRTWEAAIQSQPIETEDCMGCCPDRITIPAPWPGSSTGSQDAPANVIKNVLQPLAQMAIDHCAGSKADYVAAATAWMRQFDPNYSAAAILSEIYDQMCALDPEDQEAYTEDATYCEQFCELQECANDAGLWDLLDCLNAKLTEWLDSTNTELMDWLNKAAALMTGNGWQNAAGYGGAGGGAGFDAECNCDGWCHEFDFTLSDGDWQSFNHGVNPADIASQYLAGGWTYNMPTQDAFGNLYRSVSIKRPLGATVNITSVEVEAEDVVRGTYIAEWNDGLWSDGAQIYTWGNTASGTVVQGWAGSISTDEMAVIITLSHVASGGTLDGSGVITKITLCGTGVNPFL